MVTNNSRKPRLILDLCYVNKHLLSCKFRYEDIRTGANLFKPGDWFFKFDYVSGYHHVEIFPAHTTFLGCSWVVNGIQKFRSLQYCRLGCLLVHMFFQIQRVLVKHCRANGIRIFTFLDDGAGAESSLDAAQEVSSFVQQDIVQSVFVAHNDKCQ